MRHDHHSNGKATHKDQKPYDQRVQGEMTMDDRPAVEITQLAKKVGLE